MPSSDYTPTSLLGSLFVAGGLVTREQVEACLLLQAQDHPNIPLGQILLHCEYITENDLNRTIMQQQQRRDAIPGEIGSDTLLIPHLAALLLCREPEPALLELLTELGVKTTLAKSSKEAHTALEQPHDCTLIAPDMLADVPSLGEITGPILMLPPLGKGNTKQSAVAITTRQILQLHEQRRQQLAHERLQQREYELGIVSTISRLLAAPRSPHAAIDQLMVMIRNFLNTEAGTLYHLDQFTNQLVFEVVFGPGNQLLQQKRMPIDRGIAGWVVRHGEPLLIPDVRRDPRFEGTIDEQTRFETRSILCVPLIALGKVRGVLQLINKLDGVFTERDLLLLRIIASLGALTNILISLDEDGHEREIGAFVPTAEEEPPPPIAQPRTKSLRSALRPQTGMLPPLEEEDEEG